MSVMTTALKRFNAWTKVHPISRGMLTNLFFWPCSSLAQQGIFKEPLDYRQARMFAIYGVVVDAPVLYLWVKIATHLVPACTWPATFAKVAMDQLLYAPLAIGGFFIGIDFLEGRSFKETREELSEKFFPTWKVGAMFWPIIQTIGFGFIPIQNRVPFVGAANFFWTIFLSVQKRDDPHHDQYDHPPTL